MDDSTANVSDYGHNELDVKGFASERMLKIIGKAMLMNTRV